MGQRTSDVWLTEVETPASAMPNNISQKDAARLVRTIDRQRTDFVADHFLKDPGDPRNYDLLPNASRLGPALCARVIAETPWGFQTQGAGRQTDRKGPASAEQG